MKWKKIANRCWQAQGEKGVFTIEQRGSVFLAKYVSKSGYKEFRLPPYQKLSEAKTRCEENWYWEETKEVKK